MKLFHDGDMNAWFNLHFALIRKMISEYLPSPSIAIGMCKEVHSVCKSDVTELD